MATVLVCVTLTACDRMTGLDLPPDAAWMGPFVVSAHRIPGTPRVEFLFLNTTGNTKELMLGGCGFRFRIFRGDEMVYPGATTCNDIGYHYTVAGGQTQTFGGNFVRAEFADEPGLRAIAWVRSSNYGAVYLDFPL